GAGVDLRNAVDDFAQRNPAAEVAHGHRLVFDGDVDFLPVAHDVLIDGVVDDLLEQDVGAVIVMRAVPDAPDVHAGAQPDVFEGGERLDLALVVVVFLRIRLVLVGHTSSLAREYGRPGVVANPEFSPAPRAWPQTGSVRNRPAPAASRVPPRFPPVRAATPSGKGWDDKG